MRAVSYYKWVTSSYEILNIDSSSPFPLCECQRTFIRLKFVSLSENFFLHEEKNKTSEKFQRQQFYDERVYIIVNITYFKKNCTTPAS